MRNGVRISGDSNTAIVLITDDSINRALAAELVNATLCAAIRAGTEAALARSLVLQSFSAPQVAALENRIHEEKAEEKTLGGTFNAGASRDAISFATPGGNVTGAAKRSAGARTWRDVLKRRGWNS